MKQIIVAFNLLVIILINGFNANAQVVADFEASTQFGCTPQVVKFTNNSSEGADISYFWTFGNGETSSEKDPGVTYSDPGEYTVTLVVTGPTSTDDMSIQITVYQSPTADFSADQRGCAPHSTVFTDLSEEGDAPINQWYWDFRTGVPDDRQNPDYTYYNPGKYDVFLQVTDTNGCTGSNNKDDYIDVADPPVASFSAVPSTACQVPALIQFNNSSTGAGNLSYQWTFDDGSQSSSATDPSHSYTDFGVYTVRLITNSDYGCGDTSYLAVQVNEVVAIGSLSQGGSPVNNNDVICPTGLNFESSSTGTSTVRWEFGDGGSSNNSSGSYNYSSGGNYTVRLIAAPGNVCADTISWNITVNDVQADFSMSEDFSCMSSETVSFTDQSINPVSWRWIFDDATESTSQNTFYTFELPPEEDEYHINDDVFFTTTLEVTNSSGCTSSTSKIFRIKKPTALFTVDTTFGCKTLTVNFNDQSISDVTITNWNWIFDDGSNQSSASNSASHEYTNDGDYDARLVITNSEGCTDTSYAIKISVGKIMTPDFNVSSTTVCTGDTIQFTDNTPESGLIDGWHYYVDGESVSSITSEPDPEWIVDIDPGNHDVTLAVNYNGCISSTTKNNFIDNQGSVSDFNIVVDCDDPFVYNFVDNSQLPSSYSWDFGDGNNDNVANPTNTYSGEGNYFVSLTTTRNTCSHTITKEVKVRDPQAVITGNVTACSDTALTFSGSDSYNTVDYCPERYLWSFSNGLQSIYTKIDSVNVVFPNRGTFDVKLITFFDNGCKDSTTHSIRIYEPFTEFTADTSYGCSPLPVSFTDLTTPDDNALVSWSWNFGDGDNFEYTSPTNPIDHEYTSNGEFYVSLSVEDDMGCIGVFRDTIYTANPNASFSAFPTNLCLSDSLILHADNYNDPDSLIWNFGDGTIIKGLQQDVSHKYAIKGNYQLSLHIYKYGCADSLLRDSTFLQIQEANAEFNVSDTTADCYPAELIFTHDPEDNDIFITASKWVYGYSDNNSDIYLDTAQFAYPYPGTYTATLYLATTFGCRDTASREITVTGPVGFYDASTYEACKGDSITFTLRDTSDVWDFEWYMGDGKILQGNPVTYAYNQVGSLTPSLVLYGDSGRCIPPPVEDTILIYEVIADFTFPDSGRCNGYDILFINNSTGNDFNYWDFGNGTTGTDAEPVEQYTPGDYTIILRVENTFGCTDTMETNMTISDLPPITFSNDTFICASGTAVLSASGGDVVLWTPSTGLSNPTAYITNASPDSTMLYTVRVTDTATTCSSYGDIFLVVQQRPDINVSPPDTTIGVGEFIYFLADSLPEFSYTWDPAYALSCIDCASPVGRPLETTYYILSVSDTNNCFTETYNINIEVIENYKIELPTSFTPNGDEINDVIYVKGWGIDYLIEFRVYNRWGNEVFFTDDLNQGWDGYYKGKIQNIDSYAYVVKVMMLDGREVVKKGTFNLLK